MSKKSRKVRFAKQFPELVGDKSVKASEVEDTPENVVEEITEDVVEEVVEEIVEEVPEVEDIAPSEPAKKKLFNKGSKKK
jgi:hypothetical protein